MYKKSPRREAIEAEKRFGKFFSFHENHRYNTNECGHLRNFVEESTWKTKLQQYVREPHDDRHNAKPQGPKENQLGPSGDRSRQPDGRIVINTMTGGSHPTDGTTCEFIEVCAVGELLHHRG